MSKVLATSKIRVEDENNAAKLNKVKKFGTLGTDQTKRAAFGDLQNRPVFCAGPSAKELAQKKLTDKSQNVFRNIKARVDTHRKKTSIEDITQSESISSTTTVNNKPLAGNSIAQRKIVTRSNSLRLGTSALSTTGRASTNTSTTNTNNNVSIGVNRPPSSSLLAGQKPKTTLTAKVVEQKVQQVKYISKTTKASEGVNLVSSTFRREDSKLSRKCLSQLKAALQRDTTTNGTATKPVARVTAVQNDGKDVASSSETKVATVALNSESKVIVCKSPKPKVAIIQSHTFKFLSAVEDIDGGDGDNLILVSEYVNDIYDYLFSLENIHSIRENYLEGQIEVNPRTRAVLVDWINEVHLQFRLVGDTFQIAVAIIDRYLQTVDDTKRSLLQLVGVTALFIAAKYEELFPPTIADFVYITDNTYDARQILQMELQIFKALDCNLARPLPLHFLRRFSKAADAEDLVHGMAKYLVELALIEYELSWCKPSEVAAASLFLTLHLMRGNPKLPTGFNNKHWNSTLEWYSRYTADYLKPIARKIASIARNAPNVKLKAVYNKYQTTKFQKLSLRSELYSPLMDSIIKSKN